MASDDGVGLTGVWDGLFSYPSRFASVPFTATILHTGSLISGSIHEHPVDGPAAGKMRLAIFDGECVGNAIRFLKSYDPPPQHGKSIRYEGTLSADATEIEGRWTIPGNWSGKFLMVRSSRRIATTKTTRKVSVPA